MIKYRKFSLKYIALALGFFALNGCGEDRFTPLVEIDLPPHVSKLVVAADWETDVDSVRVFLTKSISSLDVKRFGKTEIDTVAGARVELFRNDVLIGAMPKAGRNFYEFKRFKLDSTPGVRYTLRVSAPGFETVEATQTILKKPEILRGGYTLNGAVFRSNNDPFSEPRRVNDVRLEIKDPAEEKNVYRLRHFGFIRDTLGQRLTFLSTDLLGIDVNQESIDYYRQNYDERAFLTDDTFSGKNYLWQHGSYNQYYFTAKNIPSRIANVNFVPRRGERLVYSVISSPIDFALYARSLDKLDQVSDNPFFTEPVSLHTNIKNGYGYFFISSVGSATFTVE